MLLAPFPGHIVILYVLSFPMILKHSIHFHTQKKHVSNKISSLDIKRETKISASRIPLHPKAKHVFNGMIRDVVTNITKEIDFISCQNSVIYGQLKTLKIGGALPPIIHFVEKRYICNGCEMIIL